MCGGVGGGGAGTGTAVGHMANFYYYFPPSYQENGCSCLYVFVQYDFLPSFSGNKTIFLLFSPKITQFLLPKFRSVADPDPGSGAFLTPGSGIRNRFFPDPGSRIPDPGSQTHTFESLVTIFWVKSSIILSKLAQIFFFSTSKLK